MEDPIGALLASLDVVDTGARTSEDIFTGHSLWTPIGRVFGGQVLAQSLIAAIRTLPEDRVVHSMHGYFLRPGDISAPITFSVDRIHDGRSFATRRTQAYQRGEPILSMIASFQTEDDGVEHADEFPRDVPDPESVPDSTRGLDTVDDPRAASWATDRPFELRHVDGPIFLSPAEPRVAHQAVWLRAKSPLPDDPNLHRAALAYASDYTILEAAMRRHGIFWQTPGLKMASLDHAMWWHRFARVDDWLLYVQTSPSAQGGRALAEGRIFDREGHLIASVAQEGMLRVPR